MKLIDLINKMYKNQIETGLQFTLQYKDFTLNTYEIRECEYGLIIWDLDNDCRFDSVTYILDYLDYEVEIIEQNDTAKDKNIDIEELSIKDNCLKDERGCYCSLNKHTRIIANKINELVREVNKLKNNK